MYKYERKTFLRMRNVAKNFSPREPSWLTRVNRDHLRTSFLYPSPFICILRTDNIGLMILYL